MMGDKRCCSDAEIICEGSEILRQEAASINSMAARLDDSFARAVHLLLKSKGRVAVSGMGKSGHVARKVAATFSSTGTPAYFIHPAEAAHGDLGMISPKDVLIAYSNSGDTEELISILSFCVRHRVPIIGVTKNKDSFLGKHSTELLLLPDMPEACPIGCAPTTSTTTMMSLGDALALCVLKARGFTKEHFHQYHPGGRLGRKLLLVRDIMHSGEEIPLVAENSRMPEVLYTITGKSFGCTGVRDKEGRLAGVITDGDLRRNMGPYFLDLTAEIIMTQDPVTVCADTVALEALGLMQCRSITNLFVTDENKRPIGILHIHDCLRAGLE